MPRGELVRALLVAGWRACGPLQGWLAWRVHARLSVGVTGIVRADDGRVLLLRHRLWPDGGQWGFPSGFARRGERLEDTIVREAREETGLTVRVGQLAELRSGYRYKIEAYYEARLVGGLDDLVLEEQEVLEARLFSLDALPAGLADFHRELALRPQRPG